MDFSLTKEQKEIVTAARKFAKGEFPGRAQEFDREEKFDLSLWKKACELGFVGVFIEEKYGGAGYGFFEHCLLNEEFWAVEPGIGFSILSTSFGAELLTLFGTEPQADATAFNKSTVLDGWQAFPLRADAAHLGLQPGRFRFIPNRTFR